MDGLGWLSPCYLNGTDTTKTRFSFQKRPSRPPRPMAQYITQDYSGVIVTLIILHHDPDCHIFFYFIVEVFNLHKCIIYSFALAQFQLWWYSTDLQDLVSLNNSVKLFHQIKNLSEEFSLYFDVSIRLIRLRLAHCRPRPARPVSPDCSRLR